MSQTNNPNDVDPASPAVIDDRIDGQIADFVSGAFEGEVTVLAGTVNGQAAMA